MIRTPARFTTRALLGVRSSSLAPLVCLVSVLPAIARRVRRDRGPPAYSAAPGLPDGRVYEQVSRRTRTGTSRARPRI